MATMCLEGVGALYVEGDHACARGDVVALAGIAEHLVMHASEPLHCELLGLARECICPERATHAWTELKQRIQPLAVRI